MIIENFLKNKTLSVIAPAGRVNADALKKAYDIWTSWGTKIKIMPHVTGFEKDFFSAPPELRAADLNAAFADDETDIIICARGGYGCAELAPLINWDLLRKNPKILIGYSDVTALHLMMLKYNAAVPVCGAMFIKAPELFENTMNVNSFAAAISNGKQEIHIGTDKPFCGKCVVANLAVLTSLCGTDLLCDLDGKLLILEDLNEPPYKLHRMLNQLSQSGILDRIKALGCGEFLNCGETSAEYRKIFTEFAAKHDLPLYFDLPIGHGDKIFAVNMLNDISLI